MEYSKHIEQIIIASSSILAFLVVSSALVKIVQINAENRLKRLIVEEGMEGNVPGFLSHKHLMWQHLLNNLKWAFILIFLSLGLMSSQWLFEPDLEAPLFYGYLVFSSALGLVLYYFVARRILFAKEPGE